MERSLNERLAPALDEYIEALEAGRRPDRDAHLKKHADLAAELEPCLDAIDLMFERGEAVEAGTTPKRVGDFELVRQVGRGGMGVVYEAEQISLHRRVALKMLPFAGILDPRHLQRFKNEAQAAAQLHHTNIVPVYSVGQDRGVHYYAMQFVDGISLAELIAELRATSGRDEPPSPSSAAAIEAVTKGSGARSTEYCRAVARLGVQAAQALDHAHELGIVHRDIKPANLLLDTIGHLWITDFGLASFATAPGPTITGDVVGTVRYMSPEQALAKRVPIDHRTDIYSLGASLYEAVTLEFTFPGDDARRVMHDIAFKEPVAPRRLNPAVPEELETILLKSMAKSPEHRYETAQAMADDLARFLEDRPILARRPSILRRTAQWSRRHRTLVGAVVALLLLTVIGLAVGFVLVNRERERAILSQAEAEAERARAEATLDTALRGIDEILVRQAERWEHSPGQPLARIDREFLLQAERLLDELLERNRGHAAVRLSQARMLVTAAKVRRALDRREDAMRDVEAAARMLEEVAASEAGALEALRLLVASHVGMGQLCYEVGEYDRAEIQLERAREVGEDLIATRPSDTWILDCLADGLLT
ncbi:MAG: serine/threonine-protein kinase, partial [Planctomycetota bacterium]